MKIKEENKEKEKLELDNDDDDDENDVSTSFVEEDVEKDEQDQNPVLGMTDLISQLKASQKGEETKVNKTNTKDEFVTEQVKQFEANNDEAKITTKQTPIRVPNFMQNTIKNEEFDEKIHQI